MKTDGGWVSISEAARLYGKSQEMGIQSDLAVCDSDAKAGESDPVPTNRSYRTPRRAPGEWDNAHCVSHGTVAERRT